MRLDERLEPSLFRWNQDLALRFCNIAILEKETNIAFPEIALTSP